MIGLTLDVAQQILAGILQAQIDDPMGAIGSVTVGGRTIIYKSADDLIKQVDYWQRMVVSLQRQAVGTPRFGPSRATFTCR